MRTLICSVIIPLLAIPIAWACTPEDAERAAEVAFDNHEEFDLAKLMALGTEEVNYRIEDPTEDEIFPSDQPVFVYRSHFDERAMVKVGFSPEGYDWRSVLIVLPEDMDPGIFDFPSAMQEELLWLAQLGVINGLDEGQIPEITGDLNPSARFFTREMALSSQSCLAPEECVFCTGLATYTQLPPESLQVETALETGLWGSIKALFQ